MVVPNESRIIYLEDRSGAETDDQCGMKYWWNRLEGGKGIVPKADQLALMVGKQSHEDLANLAEMTDISKGALQEVVAGHLANLTDDDRANTPAMELLYRRLGWFVAFGLFVEPKIRARYEDIGIEKEIILDRDPLYVPCQPDRLLKSRAHDTIHYLEYKSTISASLKWQQSWTFAIQMHIGIKAASEEIEQKVHYGQVMGMMKGYAKDGKLRHPYVWAYYNHQRNEWSAEYHAGMDWVLMPVWEYPDGIVAWVEKLGEEVANSQFPLSPPIFLDERKLDEWVLRRLRRQRAVRLVKGNCQIDLGKRAIYFERRLRSCRPPFGDPCPYLLCCHNAQAELDPIGTGAYVPRQPHHDINEEDIS